MTITPEDLGLLVRGGLLGLLSLCFYILKHLYTEFRKLQRDMMDSMYKDKLISNDVKGLQVKVDDLQRTINKLLSVVIKQNKHND